MGQLEMLYICGICLLLITLTHQTPLSADRSMFSDKADLEALLTLCNNHPDLCTIETKFYRKVTSTIRQSGVHKQTAILMTDILSACIEKGVSRCDLEGTVLSLNLLSQYHKDTNQHHVKRQIKSYERPRTFGKAHKVTKRNIHSIFTEIMDKLCNPKPWVCYNDVARPTANLNAIPLGNI